MGGSASVNSLPMATGKLSSSMPSNTPPPAGTNPALLPFTPPQRQATGKGPATPQNDPYFRNAPVYGSPNPADYRSFQRVPAPRAPGYDWAKIIASAFIPQSYYNTYGTTGQGGGGYSDGYGSAGGGGYGGISGRNDGGNENYRADGGRVDDMTPEEVLELARKIISERG